MHYAEVSRGWHNGSQDAGNTWASINCVFVGSNPTFGSLIRRSSSIVERPHLEETMQVQPLPSAWIIPSEPITRSEGQDMAEVMPTLTSATLTR